LSQATAKEMLVREKLRAMELRISEWEAVSLSTDAPLS
jgi:hypothetical protein